MPRFAPHQRRLDYLRARFHELGLRPNKKLGQNFLLDRNAVKAICRDAELFALDTVMEVGPGSGLLTKAMAKTGAAVLAVELDHGLAELVREETAEFDEVEIFEGDILQNKFTINPEALDHLRALHARRDSKDLKCISNLPYCVASPFLANLAASDLPWTRGVFMVQSEEAHRFTADAGTEQYGNLSVVLQLATSKIKIERAMPPAVFWPRPKVQSAVVSMNFKPLQERNEIPWTVLRRFCSAIFHARRKKMRNALCALFDGDKEVTTAFLEKQNISPDLRGEKLPPETLLHLSRAYEKHRSQTNDS